MLRLAGYQAFCWLALAFITLGGTSSRAACLVPAVGLGLTAAGAAIQRAAIRRLMPRGPRA